MLAKRKGDKGSTAEEEGVAAPCILRSQVQVCGPLLITLPLCAPRPAKYADSPLYVECGGDFALGTPDERILRPDTRCFQVFIVKYRPLRCTMILSIDITVRLAEK